MPIKNISKINFIYQLTMCLLALASIALIVLDYAHKIDLMTYPYLWYDNGILLIFTIDYFVRLLLAKDKKQFFKANIFDLLSIIPVNNLFYLLRTVRILRFVRFLKLLRILRLLGLTGKFRRFIRDNGLIYYLYISLITLLLGSSLYCISEKVSFINALWWSITTATTVGYGDISPHTGIGKFAAVLLMLLGIGFIGMLTSSITNFFAKSKDDDTETLLKELKAQNGRLEHKIDLIEKNIASQKEGIEK